MPTSGSTASAFPSVRCALLDFLAGIGTRGDITLFHYRNHGAAYGRVLVGLRLEGMSEAAIEAFVDGLGFHGEEVSGDAACRLFLNRREPAGGGGAAPGGWWAATDPEGGG